MRLTSSLLALMLVVPPFLAAQEGVGKPAYAGDPKFVAAMKAAVDYKHAQDYSSAVDSYKKAIKLSNGQCRDCLNSLYQLQMGMRNFKDAAASATQLQATAATPREKSLAEGKLGEAMLRQAGDKPKPAQLDAVHATFQAALNDFPRNQSARWSDACVLAKMGKMSAASEAFADCAKSTPPNDPIHARALHLAGRPELSLKGLAPAFQVTALNGTRFNLDEQAGKVVLIEFWATWCPACVAGIPTVKKIAKEFANEPLTVISISLDDDEDKWRSFLTKNEMTWAQYRDADNSIEHTFGVSLIPHYFTIDAEGTLTAETTDTSEIEGKLKKLIKQAKESKPVPAAQAAVTGTR